MAIRDIIFRGKRIDNGEWVEGAFLNDRDGAFYICPAASDISVSYGDNGRRMRIGCWFAVDPSTVGQYTGMTDKNGKRIFEGDKVVYPDSTSYSSYDDYNEGIVDYDEEAMRFYFTDRWSVEMEDFDVVDGIMVDVEVIGNIHDNPELVKEG